MNRRLAFAFMATTALIACRQSPITAVRIESAIQTTFANLVELQVSRLGLPPMAAPDFAVTAICRKAAKPDDTGSGEWSCAIVWQGLNRRTLRDTYELTVTTDGCYAARVAGESLGGPTLKGPDGRQVKNLLYAFEGCFDTTD